MITQAADTNPRLLSLAPHNPPVAALSDIDIKAPLERVWDLLSQPSGWPQWYADVERVHSASHLRIGEAFKWKAQGFWVISTPQEIAPCERLIWTGRALGVRAWHSWQLRVTPTGITVLTHEAFDGWLVRLMPRLFQSKLEATLASWLLALKRAAEGSAAQEQVDGS